jgi:hypothetical protein
MLKFTSFAVPKPSCAEVLVWLASQNARDVDSVVLRSTIRFMSLSQYTQLPRWSVQDSFSFDMPQRKCLLLVEVFF